MKKIIMILSVLIGLTAYGQECDYKTNEVDEFTKERKIVVKPEVLLTHTDSLLKKYYKNKDHTLIVANLANVAGYKVLYLTVKILSKDSYKYYGSISKGAECMFKTNKGMITLKFSDSDYGDVDYDYNYTLYSTYLILTDQQVSDLTDSSIDRMRFYWSKGYQDYDVMNKNLISNQLKCIK